MGKSDKEYTWRREGMLYALKVAKEQGISALEDEIKKRGLLKLDIAMPMEESKNIILNLNKAFYNNSFMLFLHCLYEEWGWRKEDLLELNEQYKKKFSECMELDYLGEHYVKIEDFAVHMNAEIGFDFDVDYISAFQDTFDNKMLDGRYCRPDGIIKMLERDGFHEAAMHMQNKLNES